MWNVSCKWQGVSRVCDVFAVRYAHLSKWVWVNGVNGENAQLGIVGGKSTWQLAACRKFESCPPTTATSIATATDTDMTVSCRNCNAHTNHKLDTLLTVVLYILDYPFLQYLLEQLALWRRYRECECKIIRPLITLTFVVIVVSCWLRRRCQWQQARQRQHKPPQKRSKLGSYPWLCKILSLPDRR